MRTPMPEREALPSFLSWGKICLTWSIGIAKAMPWPEALIAVLIPTTSPDMFKRAPPELPGLIGPEFRLSNRQIFS